MTRQSALPRRRLLAGVLALPVAAAAAVVPAIAAEDPDAELLELGRQYAEADARYDALNDQCEAALEAAFAAYPPIPEALRVRPEDRLGFLGFDAFHRDLHDDGFFNAKGIQRWRGCAPGGGFIWPPAASDRFDARRTEVLAAWDGWMDAKEQAQAAYGLSELERQLDAQGYAVMEIEHRIFALQAKTPAGWRLKAKLARRVVLDGYKPDGTYEDHVVRSLLADLTAAPEPGDRPVSV
jgi:hypothetical protein